MVTHPSDPQRARLLSDRCQEIFNHAAFRAGGTDIHYLEKRLAL